MIRLTPQSSHLEQVLHEIVAERARAAAKFPNAQRIPDGTGGAGRKTYETIARNACDRAQREGRLTHAHVLEEEAAEVLAAESVPALRVELIQLASACLGWVMDLDSR